MASTERHPLGATTLGGQRHARSGRVDNSAARAAAAIADYPTFIVLVDIDGTIIGDIDPQLTEYQLIIQGPSKKKTRENQASFRGRIFKDQLVTQLINGLMRPGFSLFCAQCAHLRIPIMLYTAAEHDWATFLTPRILQAVRLEMARDLESPPADFRFARLFTRRYCGVTADGTYRKSLDLVMKYVYASLKKDGYTMSRGMPGLQERIIMIDNTEGILEQMRNLVLVPTYSYRHMYDITANIDHTDSRRLYRARQLLTHEEYSFLGQRYARELRQALQQVENQTSSKSQAFRPIFYNVLSKAMAHQQQQQQHDETTLAQVKRGAGNNQATTTTHHLHHTTGIDPLWRTLRNRLVTYMRTVTDPRQRNAYDLAAFLTGQTSVRGLSKGGALHR